MFRLAILLCAVFMSIQQATASSRIDSLIKVLDMEIKNKPRHAAEKRARIKPLQLRLNKTKDANEKFALISQLFDEYKNFSIDTMLIYAQMGRRLAERKGTPETVWKSILMESEAYKGLGRYDEAIRKLDSLPKEAKIALGPQFLNRYSSIYYTLTENIHPHEDAKIYKDSLIAYRRRLIESNDSEEGKIINTIELYKDQGDYQGALDYFANLTPQQLESIEDMPVVNFIVGEAYVKAGRTDDGLPYLLESAISDIRNSNRKYNSLQLLASVMYEQGDLDHANDYILCSLNDIISANVQSSLYSITHALPIITTAYSAQQKLTSVHHFRHITFAVIILIILLTVLYIVRSRNKRLRSDRLRLKDNNLRLSTLHNEAQQLNNQLESTSQTKDLYIRDLFKMCSEYINIMSKEHNTMLKSVRSGKLHEVEKSIQQLESPERLASFFAKFDKCFLDLFPDFLTAFNKLLQPEYQINPKITSLTPELRIVALVKMGITETPKIATFLHYTNQTVYNYRFRTKSRVKDPNIDLVAAIRAI